MSGRSEYSLNLKENLTDEMLEFAKKERNIEREELISSEENEELRQELIDFFFDIETFEFDDDGNISERGKIAASIVDVLTYPCFEDEEDEE